MLFYDTDFIRNLLKCQHCIKSYDVYDEPRILTCCGKTLCNQCVSSVEKETCNNNKYKCIVCKTDGIRPVTGFALNELAAKLVAEQPKEAYRGKEYENLTMNLKFFECLLKKLLFETENAEFTIDEYFNDQKARVQMASEQRIQEIHRCQDILMAQLKEQKQKCLNTYSNMESFKQKTKEFISEMNAFIRQQRDYMKQLQINDNELMTANDVLLKLQKEVDMKRLSVKKLIFNNELCNFLSDEPPVIDELLGSFTRESLDSSKKVCKSIYF